MNTILVKDLMIRQPIMIHEDNNLIEAAKKMKEQECGILPVGNKQNLIGVITDRDIIVRGIACGVDPNITQVYSCMTSYIYFCHDSDNLEKALDIMLKQDVGRLLVYDNQLKVCGIITLGSILRHTMSTARVKECINQFAANDFTD